MTPTKSIALMFCLGASTGCGNAERPPASIPKDATQQTELSVERDLGFLREEEKLARDVYLHLHERWGTRAFANIAEAEQRHMDRIGSLLPSRGIEDPVADDRPGVFTDPTLATLYKQLTVAGEASETAALRVGATIEDLDIRDIQAMLTRTHDDEIVRAYKLLLCGSGNHMRAFSGLLKERGEEYVPQYISRAEYQRILDQEHQRCGQRHGGGHNGRGQGRGRGRPGGRGSAE